MQAFITNHQRKLADYLDDAFEWDAAAATAAEEEQTDWALVCSWSDKPCALGDRCPYCVAADQFFARNRCNFSKQALAESLRRIIVSGPGKDSRVPFLVGKTNTGKTTLVESFDQLFGERRVFHLPAVTDPKYALRNWLRQKRFVLWDEFSPVEFAQIGVLPVTQFKKAFNGQWFEIQVPQGFHDGNEDFRWKRGAVFTNKLEDLWEPTRKVKQEDIRHLQSRVRLFQCTSVFMKPGESRPEVPQCAHHLAKWICDGASAYDASVVVSQPLLQAGAAGRRVQGLEELLAAVAMPEAVQEQFVGELTSMGALHINEFTPEDWTELPSWPLLRPMEQRRLQNFVL